MEKNLRSGSGSGMSCPRCGGPVAVGTNQVAMQFGLLGGLLALLMTSYTCPKCGPLKFSEFPADVRAKSRWNIAIALLVGVLLLAGFIGLMVWLNWSPQH